MSSISSLASRIVLANLVLVIGGCGESPVYTRSALDAGAGADHSPLGERGPSPAGIGGAGSASGGGMSGQHGLGGAGGTATSGGGDGPCSGTGAAPLGGGGVVVAGGQTGTGAAGQGGNVSVAGPGGRGGAAIPGSAGRSTGGTSGSAGAAGTGGAPRGTGGSSNSGGAGGRLMCDGVEPISPPNGIVSDFASITPSGNSWTASNGVTGWSFAYHGGAPSIATAQLGALAHDLHCTASVGNVSYAGCGIVINSCLTAGANAALRFSVTGKSTCDVALQIQTYERKPFTDTPPGGCTAACGNYASSTSLSLSPSPVTVPLSTLTNWTTASASQIVGLEWQMTIPAGKTSCTADLRFDDIQLVP